MCIVPNYFHLTQPIKILPQDLTSQQTEIKGFVLLHSILATVCDILNFQLSELGQWRYWGKGFQTDQNFFCQNFLCGLPFCFVIKI